VWGDDGVVMIQGNIVGGSILVGLVQWQAFSPYFGDVIQKMQVRPGNKRHPTAASESQTAGLMSGKTVQLDDQSASPTTAKDDKALLPLAPAPVSSHV
jgi:hypothetical protein